MIGKQIIGNTRVKRKSSVINNRMVEAIEHKNKKVGCFNQQNPHVKSKN